MPSGEEEQTDIVSDVGTSGVSKTLFWITVIVIYILIILMIVFLALLWDGKIGPGTKIGPTGASGTNGTDGQDAEFIYNFVNYNNNQGPIIINDGSFKDGGGNTITCGVTTTSTSSSSSQLLRTGKRVPRQMLSPRGFSMYASDYSETWTTSILNKEYIPISLYVDVSPNSATFTINLNQDTNLVEGSYFTIVFYPYNVPGDNVAPPIGNISSTYYQFLFPPHEGTNCLNNTSYSISVYGNRQYNFTVVPIPSSITPKPTQSNYLLLVTSNWVSLEGQL